MRFAGLEVGEDAVTQRPTRDGHFDVDVVGRECVEVELGELRLAGLDAREEVGLGQSRDLRIRSIASLSPSSVSRQRSGSAAMWGLPRGDVHGQIGRGWRPVLSEGQQVLHL